MSRNINHSFKKKEEHILHTKQRNIVNEESIKERTGLFPPMPNVQTENITICTIMVWGGYDE